MQSKLPRNTFIREARERKGLSVMGLSKLSGVSRQTLIDAENGVRSPRLDSLERIAKALDTTPVALLGGEEASPWGLRKASNMAQRESLNLIAIREALLAGGYAEGSTFSLSESVATKESPARLAAVTAWMDFYQICLLPSLRKGVLNRLMLMARSEEIGPRDVLRVFEEIFDDADTMLREREMAMELTRTNDPDLADQEPSAAGGEQ